jgi:hypothetical protein
MLKVLVQDQPLSRGLVNGVCLCLYQAISGKTIFRSQMGPCKHPKMLSLYLTCIP